MTRFAQPHNYVKTITSIQGGKLPTFFFCRPMHLHYNNTGDQNPTLNDKSQMTW